MSTLSEIRTNQPGAEAPADDDTTYAENASAEERAWKLSEIFSYISDKLKSTPQEVLADTVSNLGGLSGVNDGAIAYATDGLKSGETTGNGTGCPVYYSNGWKVFSDDSAVSS